MKTNTPALSRSDKEALIAGRLATLGHDPAFMSPEALDELLMRARPDAQALQAALSATLFLASTEDALQIDRALVQRAVPQAEITQRAVPQAEITQRAAPQAEIDHNVIISRAPVTGRRTRWPLAGGLGIGVLLVGAGLAIWWWPRSAAPPPRMVAMARVMPPAVQPSITPRHVSLPGPVVLPDAPPAVVTLLVSASAQVGGVSPAAVTARLLQAGIARVEVQRGDAAERCQTVCYFFVQDAGLAANIAAILQQEENEYGVRNLSAPNSVLTLSGDGIRPPGSIEAKLPQGNAR